MYWLLYKFLFALSLLVVVELACTVICNMYFLLETMIVKGPQQKYWLLSKFFHRYLLCLSYFTAASIPHII